MKLAQRSARREARSLRRRKPKLPKLNPRGRAVKGLEMAARRSIKLERLCADWYEFWEGDLRRAKTNLPRHESRRYNDNGTRPLEFDWSRSKLREIFGKPYRLNPEYRAWPLLMDQWHSGAIRRQREEIMQLLPDENLERIEEVVEGQR